MNNWAKSVEAETANTEVNRLSKSIGHRNAYQVNHVMNTLHEYNLGKSVRHPVVRMKMYAELERKQCYINKFKN